MTIILISSVNLILLILVLFESSFFSVTLEILTQFSFMILHLSETYILEYLSKDEAKAFEYNNSYTWQKDLKK